MQLVSRIITNSVVSMVVVLICSASGCSKSPPKETTNKKPSNEPVAIDQASLRPQDNGAAPASPTAQPIFPAPVVSQAAPLTALQPMVPVASNPPPETPPASRPFTTPIAESPTVSKNEIAVTETSDEPVNDESKKPRRNSLNDILNIGSKKPGAANEDDEAESDWDDDKGKPAKKKKRKRDPISYQYGQSGLGYNGGYNQGQNFGGSGFNPGLGSGLNTGLNTRTPVHPNARTNFSGGGGFRTTSRDGNAVRGADTSKTQFAGTTVPAYDPAIHVGARPPADSPLAFQPLPGFGTSLPHEGGLVGGEAPLTVPPGPLTGLPPHEMFPPAGFPGTFEGAAGNPETPPAGPAGSGNGNSVPSDGTPPHTPGEDGVPGGGGSGSPTAIPGEDDGALIPEPPPSNPVGAPAGPIPPLPPPNF